MSVLKLDLTIGDTLTFDGGRIEITLLDKSGQRARLNIVAKSDVKIDTTKSNTLPAAKNGVDIKNNTPH